MTKAYKLMKSEWGIEVGTIVYEFIGLSRKRCGEGMMPVVKDEKLKLNGPFMSVPVASLEFIGDTRELPPAPRRLNVSEILEREFIDSNAKLALARRLLAGVEDRHFVLEDYEIIKHRKTGRWYVVCSSVKLEADFDHPLDAAIAINQAKEAAKLLRHKDATVTIAELGSEPTQGEVAAFLRKSAGAPRLLDPEAVRKWKNDPFAVPTHIAQLEEPPAGTPPLAEDRPISFRGMTLNTWPTLGGPDTPE